MLGGLLLVGLTWAWIQGAKVPTGTIDQDDYAAGATAVGQNVYDDLVALETAVNSIDSSQTSSSSYIEGAALQTNNIPYNKIIYHDFDVDGVSWLFKDNAFDDTTFRRIVGHDAIDNVVIDSCFSRGVLVTVEQGQQFTIWGDAWLYYKNACGTYDLEDTVLADSCWDFMIDFWDSSDCGVNALGAAPSYVNISAAYEAATPATFGDCSTEDQYNLQRDGIGDLTFSITFLSADSCSVHVHHTGSDTIAVSGYKIFWEARE
jgi:hypothetical protein